MLIREVVVDAKTGKQSEVWTDSPTTLDPKQADALAVQLRMTSCRAERNRRLTECDWSTKSDVPMDEATRAAWLVYRQALRDVTAQEGFPDAITWPDVPMAWKAPQAESDERAGLPGA